MTTNQLEYRKLQETETHNRITEQYNRDYLAETTRHNIKSEELTAQQIQTTRYVAELQSATSIKVASISANAAVTSASISASATKYVADLNAANVQKQVNAQLTMNAAKIANDQYLAKYNATAKLAQISMESSAAMDRTIATNTAQMERVNAELAQKQKQLELDTQKLAETIRVNNANIDLMNSQVGLNNIKQAAEISSIATDWISTLGALRKKKKLL